MSLGEDDLDLFGRGWGWGRSVETLLPKKLLVYSNLRLDPGVSPRVTSVDSGGTEDWVLPSLYCGPTTTFGDSQVTKQCIMSFVHGRGTTRMSR